MANNRDTAVAKVSGEEAQGPFESALPAIADENIVEIAAKAEERLEALDQIKHVALRLTNPNDWVDENGKPYLQSSGAEKVARLFGISWRINEPTVENLEGGHYIVTYTGEFALSRAIITVVGTRSSKDPFFKKYEYKDDVKKELPPSEIDPGDVKKAAYSNLIVNGITRLLGLRNLTYEDLQEYAKITQSQVHSITYKKGGKAPSSPGSKAPSTSPGSQGKKETKQPGSPDDPATQAQAQAIHSILDNKGVKDELTKMQTVQSILGLKEVPTSVGKLTKGQASKVIHTLQTQIQEATSEASQEAEGGE